MADSTQTKRPLSPHLQIYKWEPHMLASILHRVSGDGLAIVGTLLFLWWLGAVAGGEQSYAAFLAWVWEGPEDSRWHQIANIAGRVGLIGLTWAFFQHLFSGLRHLILDTGAGYELITNRRWAIAVVVSAVLATAALWLWVFYGGLI